MSKEVGDEQVMALSLAGLGEIATVTGTPERGAMLLGVSATLYEAVETGGTAGEGSTKLLGSLQYEHNYVRARHARAVALTRTRLDEEAFHDAWHKGRAMSVEGAARFVLELEGTGNTGAKHTGASE